MTEVLHSVDGWRGLLFIVVAFGLLPGLILRAIVRVFPREDPRRRELRAELCSVPSWERPLWVAQQFEVALIEGGAARLHRGADLVARAAIGRVFRSEAIRQSLLEQIEEVPTRWRFRWALAECVSGRRQTWSLGSGVTRHARWPETFEIPESIERQSVRQGDSVKLIFETSDDWTERMWVEVTGRRRGNFIGLLRCTPVGITRLGYGDRVVFTPDHIIDLDPHE